MADHPDHQEPLRQDVRQLGRVLGDVLQQQVGRSFYEQAEQVRRWSSLSVRGDTEARAALDAWLRAARVEDLHQVGRAFGHFLNLANIAEQYHGLRRRRQEPSNSPREGSLRALFTRCLQAGITPERLREAIDALAIDLVLTAHPTEVSRRTLIQKQDEIASELARQHQAVLTDEERVQGAQRLHDLLVAAWETDEIRTRRPTPVEEARWGFATIETSLWQALPDCLRTLDEVMREQLGEGLPLSAAPLRFGSWMGGDRDGNPFVTHDVTARVLLLSRWMAVDLHLRDLDRLRGELSMSRCGPLLAARVSPASREPYRDWLRQVRDRLQATQAINLRALDGLPPEPADAQPYVDSASYFYDLKQGFDDLHAAGMGRLADGLLLDMLRRVSCFGLPLMRLDIRQESGRHAETLDAITRYLGLGSYLDWDETRRQAFLLAELDNPRPLLAADWRERAGFTPEVREVLETFAMLACQPAEALGAYIISMAHQPSDVLAVWLLQRKAGIASPLRVVPLFETYDDLAAAPSCLDALLGLPACRALVGDRQEVMIGYSDSAKDAGFIAAAWAQYQAQEGLAAVAARHGVRLVLFHGRGGTVSRGGAPTHQALRSQPPGTVAGALRVTEQGEMIRMKFGMPAVARDNLERYLSATLEVMLMPPPPPEPAWRDTLAALSRDSMQVYRAQLREDPDFVSYLRTVTPEPELALLPLGSRPARRRSGGGIETLRAIPWVFAWTQIRLMLPAWLGVYEAMQARLSAPDGERALQDMQRWPFFAGLVDMLEMVLEKSDLGVAEHYERELTTAPGHQRLGAALRQRHGELMRLLAQWQTGPDWQTRNPVLAQSIRLRAPYLLPLHLLQAELMMRRRAEVAARPADQAEAPTAFDHALMVTMTGIAAGMRNTG